MAKLEEMIRNLTPKLLRKDNQSDFEKEIL